MSGVTIKDIANEVGVSHPTVSKALAGMPGVNKETRKKILETARRMNYVPNVAAQRLAKRKSRSIGFIWNSQENLFLYHLCNQLQKEAERKNIDLLITMSEPSKAVEDLYSHCVDYIFTFGNFSGVSEEKISEYKKNGCGFMIVGGREISGIDNLVIDRTKGIYNTIEYLYNCGHKNIAFFGKETEKKYAFVSAVKEYGIFSENNVVYVENDYYKDYKKYEEELLCKFSKLYNSADAPTALLLDSQNLAMGFLNVFSKLKISIPDDLSLITYDDIPEYFMYPVKLTTVSPSFLKMAEIIINKFEEHYGGNENKNSTCKVVPELTLRDSVKKIND